MKTKLLFLSLALMTLGGTSEVKADTTIADLTATNTESTYIHGALADYSYWTLEGTGGGLATSTTRYIAWFYYKNTTSTLSTTSDVELPAGTYLLSSNLIAWKSSTNSLAITSEDATTTFATKNINVVGKNYTAFYISTAQKVKLTFTVTYGGTSGTTEIAEQVLYTVKEGEATEDYTTILSGATTAQIEGLIAGMSEAKKALRDILESADAAYTNYAGAVGSGIFQYQSSYYEALGSAKTAAQSVYNDDSSTDEQYEAQTTALTTAYDDFFANRNLPDTEKYYYIKNTASEGIYYLNLSDDYSEGVGRNRLSTIPYAVQFETAATAGKYYIKSPAGKYVYAATTWENGMSTDSKSEWTVVTNGDGKISFYITAGYLWTPWSLNTSTTVGKSNSNPIAPYWTVTEAGLESVTANITSADWGTFVAPFAVNLTGDLAGVEAYTITTDGTTITKSEALSTIPANTPVLLHKTGGLSATNVKGYAQSYYTGLPEEGNLVGFLASGGSVPASVEKGDTYYVLQKQAEVVGWYKVTSALTGTANRAYLKVPAAAGGEARQFMPLFGDSETTAIMSVNTEGITANDYYNLNGQRVSQPAKGLYIVGGKKVMVK